MFSFINAFLPSSLIYGFLMILGACFGSFVGLVIYRLPKGQSIISPGSHCSACKTPLKPWHNIPVFSWLLLRGKCAYCEVPIEPRLFFMELLFGLCLVSIYTKYGFTVALVERFLFVLILICLAYIDLDTLTLPLSLLFALVTLGLGSTLIYALNPSLYVAQTSGFSVLKLMIFNRGVEFSLGNRLWGALVGLVFFSCVNVFATLILRKSRRLSSQQWAMGWGDPLLLMSIGLIVGLSHLVLVIFLASALGSVIGLMSAFIKERKIRDKDVADNAIPYGPFLAIAAIYCYLF